MTIKNFRVGGIIIVILVVDSVAVNIRKSCKLFTPFESSKPGTLLSSPPCSYPIKCMRYLLCYYLFSPLLFCVRKSAERNKFKKKQKKQNEFRARSNRYIYLSEKRKKREDFQEEIYLKFKITYSPFN